MKRLILQPTRDDWPKLRFGLNVCTITALVAAGLMFSSCARNLTGTYIADDGGIYYLQQSGGTLWWGRAELGPRAPGRLRVASRSVLYQRIPRND